MNCNLPLYLQITQALKKQILSGKLRPGDRVPSENELAKHFHVSVITSKRALNNLADEGLIVRAKGTGSFVAGENGLDVLNSANASYKGIIGIIIPSICMPVESEMLYHLQSLFHLQKYQTLVRVSNDNMESEAEAIRIFSIFGVRGFVIFPAINENYNEEILRMSINHIPHVLVDRYLSNIPNSYIVSDSRTAAEAIVRHLWEKGHEKIAFLTQQDTNTSSHDRFAGFEDAYRHAEKQLNKSAQYFLLDGSATDNDCKIAMRAFFAARPEITAVVAMDTVLACLGYTVLCEMKKPIPQEITLISFDDPKLLFVPYVEQNIKKMAARTVEILIRQIECEYAVTQEKIPMQFVKDVSYPLPFGLNRKAKGESLKNVFQDGTP